MELVYSNAVFTISAVKSASDDGGCFSTNRGNHCRGVASDGSPYTVIARRKTVHWKSQHTPLLSRRWVFQERILSPRVVHFGEQEVFWECSSHTTCQCKEIENASMEREVIQESGIGAKKYKYAGQKK